MREKRKQKVMRVIGSIVLSIIGFIVIPSIINKYGIKVYKHSMKKGKVDFDNLGPKIVKKGETKED